MTKEGDDCEKLCLSQNRESPLPHMPIALNVEQLLTTFYMHES